MTTELTLPEEKEPFKFTGCEGRPKADEDLWAPRKVTPAVYLDDVGYSDIVPGMTLVAIYLINAHLRRTHLIGSGETVRYNSCVIIRSIPIGLLRQGPPNPLLSFVHMHHA